VSEKGFNPSMPRKAFIIESFDHESWGRARLESVPNPRWEKLPEVARDAVGEGIPAEVLKLTMPDDSEWLIEEQTLRDLLHAVAEARAYTAGFAAGQVAA
jgi:hypothetical protein